MNRALGAVAANQGTRSNAFDAFCDAATAEQGGDDASPRRLSSLAVRTTSLSRTSPTKKSIFFARVNFFLEMYILFIFLLLGELSDVEVLEVLDGSARVAHIIKHVRRILTRTLQMDLHSNSIQSRLR
jgi:hypothetical protein